MKNKWSKYALKDGKIQSSYLREYSNKSPKRRLLESGKDETKEIELVYREPVHPIPEKVQKIIDNSWVIDMRPKEKKPRKKLSKPQ